MDTRNSINKLATVLVTTDTYSITNPAQDFVGQKFGSTHSFAGVSPAVLICRLNKARYPVVHLMAVGGSTGEPA
jgi:hypothetical protein